MNNSVQPEHILLKSNVRQDLEAIDTIYGSLEGRSIVEETTQDELIVVSYWLNNLYNAIENIFRNIASTFENHLTADKGWHAQLLQRMKLDLRPVRPAVIDSELYAHLDELRRFRHLFRSAYSIEVDAKRLTLVYERALQAQGLIDNQIESFLSRIDQL